MERAKDSKKYMKIYIESEIGEYLRYKTEREKEKRFALGKSVSKCTQRAVADVRESAKTFN